ncbi:MAG: chorismate synthase [Turicimonas muris]
MAGSSIGKLLVVTNFGESHGPAIGAVIDGVPPGMKLDVNDIQVELDRRKPGTSRHVTQRKESDTVEILSGVYNGVTTGTPIGLLIRNEDQKSKDYSEIANLYRPAHADWTYAQKYGIRDPRGGGRSSARLTAPTVAAGAIAKKWLKEQFNINIQACLVQLGNLELPINDWDEVDQNSFFCADKEIIPQLESFMDSLRKSGDSAGGRVFVKAENVPVGIGQPIYDRLDAELAFAFMGLNAVKGVEIGEGIKAARLKGSQNADQMDSKAKDHFLINHSCGILGGISTGQTVYATVSIKPTPSIRLPLATLNSQMQDTTVSTKGRHDPCVSIRAVPVLEALMALVLMDLILQNHAQTGW